MRRVAAVLTALLVALSLGWGLGVLAQQAGEVEGKIQSVDPSGRVVTLEDGTQLTIPDNVRVQRDALKEGAMVKASFEEKNGQKIVINIEVKKE